MTIEDAELLRRFVASRDEESFAEIVRRRIDFVYAVALRRTGGDAHLARDVAQAVFLDLSRKAGTVSRHPAIVSWLYTSTRFAAAQAMRTQARWRKNQERAHAMDEMQAGARTPEPDWEQLRPVLDAAMDELGEPDRRALLLRYFEGRPLAEVGAQLGLGENSARMRVERAVEKLRVRLARRGIVSTAAALGTTLAAQPVVTAPAGLAPEVAGAASADAGRTMAVPFLSSPARSLLAWSGLAVVACLVCLHFAPQVMQEFRRDSAPAIVLARPLYIRRAQVVENLKLLRLAAVRYQQEHGRAAAGVGDLVGSGPGKYLRTLVAVDGEDYSRLEWAAPTDEWTVTLAGGERVTLAAANDTAGLARLEREIELARLDGTRSGMFFEQFEKVILEASRAHAEANGGRPFTVSIFAELPTLAPYIRSESTRRRYLEEWHRIEREVR